mmetsp:Transcript_87246/g.249972  ORF Transcript_87246/g.249972 Transcript_87246/m.249972 type:complete len:256 (-) Transcript_87246:82-849(-)
MPLRQPQSSERAPARTERRASRAASRAWLASALNFRQRSSAWCLAWSSSFFSSMEWFLPNRLSSASASLSAAFFGGQASALARSAAPAARAEERAEASCASMASTWAQLFRSLSVHPFSCIVNCVTKPSNHDRSSPSLNAPPRASSRTGQQPCSCRWASPKSLAKVSRQLSNLSKAANRSIFPCSSSPGSTGSSAPTVPPLRPMKRPPEEAAESATPCRGRAWDGEPTSLNRPHHDICRMKSIEPARKSLEPPRP